MSLITCINMQNLILAHKVMIEARIFLGQIKVLQSLIIKPD